MSWRRYSKLGGVRLEAVEKCPGVLHGAVGRPHSATLPLRLRRLTADFSAETIDWFVRERMFLHKGYRSIRFKTRIILITVTHTPDVNMRSESFAQVPLHCIHCPLAMTVE